MVTINGVEGVGGEFDSLVDVFVFLLGGEHFLFLFLLASVQIGGQVHVGVVAEFCEGGDVGALVDCSAVGCVLSQ